MQPRYLSFLSLMLIDGTPLCKQAESGDFEELSSDELLGEAYDIIKGLNLNKTIFRSNHASNYLPIRAKLPEEKEKTLALIANALDGKIELKPEYMRAL